MQLHAYKSLQIPMIALGALLSIGSTAMADSALDDAISAYRHGDFKKSSEIFSDLADGGNAAAQYFLSCQMINVAGI